jgi:tetratricopeptide (TPR) repeat protein
MIGLKRLHSAFASVLAAAALLHGGPAQAQAASICGTLEAAQGPYDFRVERYWVTFIERNHFNAQVEAGIRGISGHHPGPDIDYLLRYVPNHPRALLAMTRLSERNQWTRPAGATYDVECYYERALRFRPDDTVPRVLFAGYLAKRSRMPEALAELARAATFAGDNAFSHYNIGLQYFEFREYDKALEQAHRALALGFPRMDLAERLRAVGRWRDPPAAASAPESAGSSSR